VDRPRLYRILDSPLVRLCIVQGPSGAGKTTLLRSWAARQGTGHPTVWIPLSASVGGRRGFWQHVLGSAKRMGDLSEKTASRVAEQMGVAADPVPVVAGVLAGAGPVTLIFDAYEHLGDAMSAVDEDLSRLLDAAPEARVMITSRGHTALADLDLQGEGITRVISLGELAFTTEEVGALMASQAGVDDDRVARSIAESTHGYALTVRAAVLALGNLGRIPHVGSMEWAEVVAAQLQSQLPDEVDVQFVIDTSVPPYVDVDLARQLTGESKADLILNALERNGFGRWIPYARHRQVFQYVETIRDTFRAAADDDPARCRRSCVTTAEWFFANDDVSQAMQFAVDGGDYTLADRCFVHLVITEPDSYITDRFLPVLQRVPRAVLKDYPMLAFGLSLALLSNPALRFEGPRVAQIAIDSTAEPSYLEPAVDEFSLVSMKAIARRLTGKFRESSEACVEAVKLAPEIDPAASPELGEHVGTVLRQLSYSLLQGGEVDAALSVMNRSISLCVSPAARNYSLAYAAGANAFAGDLTRARAFQAAIDTAAWPEGLQQSYMNGLGLMAEGYARLDAMDFAGALDLLSEAESYMQTAEFWPFLTTISVLARQGLGQAQAEAERVTAELEGSQPPPGVGDNVATEHLHAVLAHAWIDAGDPDQAARLVRTQPEDSPFVASARIGVRLRDGRSSAALQRARESLELSGHTHRSRAAVQTIGAVAALRQDASDLARRWLNSAAVSYETYGLRAHVAMFAPRSTLAEFARECDSPSLRRYLEIPPHMTRPSGPATVSLTPRESVVLNMLGEHGSVREIAEALVVSPHTVKTQLQGVYRKLGVSSRRAALEVAHELGLIDDGED